MVFMVEVITGVHADADAWDLTEQRDFFALFDNETAARETFCAKIAEYMSQRQMPRGVRRFTADEAVLTVVDDYYGLKKVTVTVKAIEVHSTAVYDKGNSPAA